MTRLRITAPRLHTGTRVIAEAGVLIEDGQIAACGPARELPDGNQRIDLDHGMLAPGFVDVQVNGGGGKLLNDAPTLATVAHLAARHRRFGTTALLPTVITDRADVIRQAADAVRDARQEGVAGVIGLHIEGPFIDHSRKGAHPPEFIRLLTDEDVRWLMKLDCGRLLVTLSPRQATLAQINALAEAGITVSLGHTDATGDEARAALRAGARGVTHLYNAMSQLTAREAGLVGAALTTPDCYCGLIADGQHVSDAALTIALGMKGRDRIVLVSDAMPPAAGGPDQFTLQGRLATRQAGRLTLADGTLAGAAITLGDAVHRLVSRGLARLEDAIVMATATPAALIGAANEVGQIAPGRAADIVHLDEEGRFLSRLPVAAG